MNAVPNRLLLLVVATGLTLGMLPAAPSAQAVPASVRAVGEQTITMQLSKDSIRVGGMVDVTGTLTSAPRGTSVQVQRESGDAWVTVGTTRTTSTTGAFALRNVIAPVKGAFLYRATAAPSTTPLVSGYSWLIVTAKNPPTIVSGFVEAGGPVAGSTVKIFVPGRIRPVRTAVTTEYGYFLARIPTLPKSLLVVATGGIGPIGKFNGTMTALVAGPSPADTIYVNPATTLVAAYLTDHPRASRSTADRKVRDLLGLESYHNLGSALGGRPSYFDSVEFLRIAERNGGFDAYVARLVERIDHGRDPVTFRHAAAPATGAEHLQAGSQGAAIAGLIGEDASGYLGVAAQGASVINASLGLMTLVGSLVGWTPSGGPTPSQIMNAVDQVQSTLSVIETQLSNLTSYLQDDFNELNLKIDQTAYNDAMNSIIVPAYGRVATAHDAYKQYVHDQYVIALCVPAPSDPSAPLVAPAADCPQPPPLEPLDHDTVQGAINESANDLATFKAAASALEGDLAHGDSSRDVFHDALLSHQGTAPALGLLRNVTVDQSGQVFLPASSAAMQDFAATILTNQSWAYYLTMAYEKSIHVSTSDEAADISINYLGSDYANYIKTYPYAPGENSLSRPLPASGNFRDEVTYLQSILPVPEWMAIDTNPGGLMYMTTSPVGLASTYLPAAAADRDRCVQVVAFAPGYRDYPVYAGGTAPNDASMSEVCTALAEPLRSLDAAMATYAVDQGTLWGGDILASQPPATVWSGLTAGWGMVSQGALGAILPRLAGAGDDSWGQDYFNPGPVWFPEDDGLDGEHGYWVQSGNYVQCSDPPGAYPNCSDSNQTYVSPVIDWMKLYYKNLSGADVTCTWAVGGANDNTDPCSDMPALVARPLQTGEVYLPPQ